MTGLREDLLWGELVHLTAEDPQTLASQNARWGRDSEFYRLLDSDPVTLWSSKKLLEWIEKDQSNTAPSGYGFSIRTNQENILIGFVGLFGHSWAHGDCWVGIGIGEREYWGKGYGTDAMRLALRFAFTELNLYRVTLGVFGYNLRAIRSYEKVGFRREGIARQELRRAGERWDAYYMGILREEWEQCHES